MRAFFIAVMLLSQVLSGAAASNTNSNAAGGLPILIAHAGGAIGGYEGSNSLEALILSAERGFTYIETDIIRTTDDMFVLAHDWEFMSNRVPLAPDLPVTADAFSEYKIYNKFTAVTLDGLVEFLARHESVTIITDTKDADYGALCYIAEHYPQYISRFIPQVYSFGDYDTIKSLGYERIIVTVYAMSQAQKLNPEQIYAQAVRYGAFAVTIPDELLQSADYINALKPDEVTYFTHTINTKQRLSELLSLGIRGVYTDTLTYDMRSGDGVGVIADSNRNNAAMLAAAGYAQAVINGLTDASSSGMVFMPGREIIINGGVIEPAGAGAVCGMFTDADTAYLPLHKLLAYLGGENGSYSPAEKRCTFDYNGAEYGIKIGGDVFEITQDGITEQKSIGGTAVIYRDYIFLPQAFYENVFKCAAVTNDASIIIYNTPQNEDIAPQ